MCVCIAKVQAQVMPMSNTPGSMNNVRDTAANKTNTTDWKDEKAKVFYKQLNSQKRYEPDSSIHTFHRRPFLQPWNRDLGNLGSAARNLYFTPEHRVGPTLGYRAFDIYRYDIDSLYFYNTTRPYSVFTYLLGSKLEQVSQLLHSQNVTPFWNITAQYRKINSQGFYKAQRMNNDNAFVTTNYKSKKQHYQLNGAIAYNKEQQDENGGITDETLLTDPDYSDRKVMPVNFDNSGYSTRRSAVTNLLRDVSVLLDHSYTIGKEDSVYSTDSTSFTYRLIPRFRISHRMEYRNEKHLYKDQRPDSLRYDGFFTASIPQNDSIFSEQRWSKIDNRVLLNGYFGQAGKQLAFSAGIGNRFDQFQTEYLVGNDRVNTVSNYIIGELKKEILAEGQWGYNANALFYFTGRSAGDFDVRVSAAKDFKKLGSVNLGLQQQLQSAPYNYTMYANQFYVLSNTFSKESITQLYLNVYADRLKLSLGLRNYVVGNYIYLDATQKPAQSATAFNITQLWLRKLFRFGKFAFDNELAFQQKTGAAPVNVPTLMGKHQLSFESNMFKSALKASVGIEVRYHTDYASAGYSPFMNRFYYQDTYTLSNMPEGTFFFNFRIKQFRASLSLDQLQQLFGSTLITTRGYAAQDLMLRFGFSWTLIN
jgi:hypothetical protein